MPRLVALAPLLLATMLAVGCQVATQAAEIFRPQDKSNYLDPMEIIPISSLQITKKPKAGQHSGEILTLQPLPANIPTLISVGQDGRVLGWDLQSAQGYELKSLQARPKVVALGETKALIAWSDESGISVACIEGCANKKTLTALKARPSALTFHDDDSTLLIGGVDGRVYRWRFMDDQDASSTEERERMLERYIGHQTMVSGVVGHSVGRAFFSSDWDGSLIGWLTYTADDHEGIYDKNVFRGRFYTDIPAAMVATRPKDRGISALAISKDGERVALGTEDGFVEVWQVKGFSLAARKSLHSGRVTSVALSDDGERVASIGKDSKVRVQMTIPDQMYTLSPSALPALLEEISEHYIPLAHRSIFLTPARLGVGTKNGEVMEVKLAEPTVKPPRPTPKPRSAPRAVDGDY